MIHQQDVSAEAEVGVGFLDELIGTPEGDAILGCLQCGTCSGSCPLGVAMEYPPRRMILQAKRVTWRACWPARPSGCAWVATPAQFGVPAKSI